MLNIKNIIEYDVFFLNKSFLVFYLLQLDINHTVNVIAL